MKNRVEARALRKEMAGYKAANARLVARCKELSAREREVLELIDIERQGFDLQLKGLVACNGGKLSVDMEEIKAAAKKHLKIDIKDGGFIYVLAEQKPGEQVQE